MSESTPTEPVPAPTTSPTAAEPAKRRMPDPLKDPVAFEAWALSADGQEYFRYLNEELIKAHADGGVAPATVGINIVTNEGPTELSELVEPPAVATEPETQP